MRERAFKLSRSKTQFILDTHGMSARVGKTIGASKMEMSHYLHGNRLIPESRLIRLCKATSKSPVDFFEDDEQKKVAQTIELT